MIPQRTAAKQHDKHTKPYEKDSLPLEKVLQAKTFVSFLT